MLRASPFAMPPADADEPRHHYRLKPREIVRVNEPRGTLPPARSATDVHQLLQANLRQDRRAGRYDVAAVRQRRSRRRRDYLLALLLGNGALVGAFVVLPKNVVTLLFAGGGVILFTVGLTWTMFAVLDDY